MNDTFEHREIGFEYLTWINNELRKEIERRQQQREQQELFTTRIKAYVMAGLSGALLLTIKLLDL